MEAQVLEPKIEANDLETWAGFLLDHSLGGITADDRVMIKGERICWPLMQVLEHRVIAAGAVPDIFMVPPNNDRGRIWSAAMGRLGNEAQLAAVPEWFKARYESMTKYVEILGSEDAQQFTGLEPAQLQALATADRPYANIRLGKPWVITLYPTPSGANLEGIELEEYTSFIVNASTTDPGPLREAEERIAPLFVDGKQITIVTEHPEQHRQLSLTMDISLGRPVISYGLRNFPDGEIFTSPDARSPEGEIYVDLPVTYGGNDIQGIYLKLEKGRIIDYQAAVGHQHLSAIIETDEGSHRLGEVALGMNPGLDRVLKHPLFVEKVGGTLHIAIGASYEDCFVETPGSEAGKQRITELQELGALNRSSQHVDIVTDFRPGGCGREVCIGDVKLAQRDGIWVAG
jgi:aminopeptidase